MVTEYVVLLKKYKYTSLMKDYKAWDKYIAVMETDFNRLCKDLSENVVFRSRFVDCVLFIDGEKVESFTLDELLGAYV